MNCPQCSRWLQLGLAVLASNLPTTVNAATLEDYTDGAMAAGMAPGIESPDAVEDVTDESTSDIAPVESSIEPEQPAAPAFTNPQPTGSSQPVPLAEENEADNFSETAKSLSEETALTEERALEPVTIAVGMSQGFTVPAAVQGVTVEPTSDIAPVEGLEQPTEPTVTDLQSVDESAIPLADDNEVGNLEIENFSETSESLSEELELSEESSFESVETLSELPSEALPTTRVISPDGVPEDTSDHVAASNDVLTKATAKIAQPAEVSLPKETISTLVTMPPEISEPSIKSEEVLIAQVIPDDTLGAESSIVVPNEMVHGAPADVIEGGASRGSNLFHSFEAFSIDPGQRVYFAEPVGVENILSRVTGEKVSEIDGLLGVNGTTNLFFLNPNGITFGPNAELDISGSFRATTAEAFTFPDGNQFSAVNPSDPPVLTMSVMPGVQFGLSAQGLNNETDLAVGQNLALSGGAVTSNGQLTAVGELIVESTSGDMEVAHLNARTALLSADGGNLILNGSQLSTADNLTLQTTETLQIQDSLENPFNASAGGDLVLQATQVIDMQDLDGPDGNNSPVSQLSAGRDLILRSPILQLGNRTEPNNALYRVGSYFRTELLDGSIIDLFVPYRTNANEVLTVRANEDIEIDRYFGPSLYILSGGQVTAAEDISVIPGFSEDDDGFPLPDSFNVKLHNEEIVTLQPSSHRPVLDIRAGVEQQLLLGGTLGNTNFPFVNTSIRPLQIGTEQTDFKFSLDTSSSVDRGILLGDFAYLSNSGGRVTLVSEGDIRLPDIETSSESRFSPDDGGDISISSTFGDIIIEELSSFSLASSTSVPLSAEEPGGNARDGGNISISSITGNIKIETLDSSSSANAGNFSTPVFSGDASTGGDIFISSVSGDITIGSLDSSSSSSSRSFDLPAYSGNASTGGDISISSISGNIIIGSANSLSSASSVSSSSSPLSLGGGGNSGNGGDISVSSVSGDLMVGSLDSSSLSFAYSLSYSDYSGLPLESIFLLSGNAGNGGDIALSTGHGELIGNNSQTNTFSIADQKTGSGGTVTFEASIVSGFDVFTLSRSGMSGDVNLSSLINTDLEIRELRLRTSGEVQFQTPNRSLTIPLNLAASQAGNTLITSDGGITLKESQILADTNNSQPAGSVAIISPSHITFNNSQVSSNANSIGNAGEILIEAARLILSEGDLISAETSASGTGGTITINATESVALGEGVQDSAPVISVEASSSGRPGNIVINTPDFILSETARITATATESATNPEGGGSITLSADQMDLAGTVGIFAETAGQSPGGVLTLQPYRPNPDLETTNPTLDVALAPGAEISASTSGTGRGGSLRVLAPEAITIAGAGKLAVETTGPGLAGDIEITTQELTLTDRVTVSTSTNDTGQAGSILLNADILNVTDGAEILAATEGSGDGGTIIVNAPTAVNLGLGVQDFAPILSVETSDAGRAGNIFINTPNFILSETARITATATDSATNPEGGGSITLSSDQMDLAGIVGIFAETQGQSPGGVLTLQPYRPNPELETTNPNLNLDLETGAVISASTSSSGNGGNLQVLAPDTIDISGPGLLAVRTSGSGRAGNITAESQHLRLSDGVTVSASTTDSGQAGNIDFTIADSLTINGSQVESRTDQGSTGAGGNITLNTGSTELRNGGRLAVNSDGQGAGGNVVLESDELSLDNSEIKADTLSSDGGNLTLELQDLLTLRNGSLISTEAGTADSGGNGGNINIRVADGFVIAVPIEDNDIIANAFEGNGGEVNITANRILGLTPRSSLRSAELRGNASSDVSASSELGLNGEIDLLNLLLDPSQGLTELPANLEDPTNRIARGCRADDIAGDTANPTGDFVITGRSGQPLNPGDSADDATTLDDLGPVDAQIDLSVPTTRILEPIADRATGLEDAHKAVMTNSGDILLVANNTWHSSVSCSALR